MHQPPLHERCSIEKKLSRVVPQYNAYLWGFFILPLLLLKLTVTCTKIPGVSCPLSLLRGTHQHAHPSLADRHFSLHAHPSHTQLTVASLQSPQLEDLTPHGPSLNASQMRHPSQLDLGLQSLLTLPGGQMLFSAFPHRHYPTVIIT